MAQTTLLESYKKNNNDTALLIKEMVQEKGKTCVSIIIPTHRSGGDRQGDRLEIERSVFIAKQAIQNEPRLIDAIDSLVEKIDHLHNKDGVGIFVSHNIQELVQFPFPVTKKITIGKLFDLQDLLYVENYKIDYYVLDISKKEIKLFEGLLDSMHEIKEKNFPREIVEEYEYSKPSLSSSDGGYANLKGFEKDKSILTQLHLKNIFHELDRSLAKYVSGNNKPIILCGASKTVELYKSVTNYLPRIITTISDNFYDNNLNELENFAWLQIQAWMDIKKLKLVDEFREKIGEKKAAYGIENILSDAKEGKGYKLIVEKNFSKQDPSVKYGDVVNEIINTVLEKNGEVIIVEKDSLREFERIAMINRY